MHAMYESIQDLEDAQRKRVGNKAGGGITSKSKQPPKFYFPKKIMAYMTL